MALESAFAGDVRPAPSRALAGDPPRRRAHRRVLRGMRPPNPLALDSARAPTEGAAPAPLAPQASRPARAKRDPASSRTLAGETRRSASRRNTSMQSLKRFYLCGAESAIRQTRWFGSAPADDRAGANRAWPFGSSAGPSIGSVAFPSRSMTRARHACRTRAVAMDFQIDITYGFRESLAPGGVSWKPARSPNRILKTNPRT